MQSSKSSPADSEGAALDAPALAESSPALADHMSCTASMFSSSTACWLEEELEVAPAVSKSQTPLDLVPQEAKMLELVVLPRNMRKDKYRADIQYVPAGYLSDLPKAKCKSQELFGLQAETSRQML